MWFWYTRHNIVVPYTFTHHSGAKPWTAPPHRGPDCRRRCSRLHYTFGNVDFFKTLPEALFSLTCFLAGARESGFTNEPVSQPNFMCRCYLLSLSPALSGCLLISNIRNVCLEFMMYCCYFYANFLRPPPLFLVAYGLAQLLRGSAGVRLVIRVYVLQAAAWGSVASNGSKQAMPAEQLRRRRTTTTTEKATSFGKRTPAGRLSCFVSFWDIFAGDDFCRLCSCAIY